MSLEPLKLNIGCGGRPLDGYVNIDSDDLLELKERYPTTKFSANLEIYGFDIFNLPYGQDTVDEIRADSLIEHLNFNEEPKFFQEVYRVLKRGGIFEFSTTNFDKIVEIWLRAEDQWKEFFRSDKEAIAKEHWFGQYSYSTGNKWGYLTAMIYGTQNGEGQYHKNCYTIAKIRAILAYFGFEEIELSEFLWKENRDPMIYIVAKKT